MRSAITEAKSIAQVAGALSREAICPLKMLTSGGYGAVGERPPKVVGSIDGLQKSPCDTSESAQPKSMAKV
jgi:hypothetical protein